MVIMMPIVMVVKIIVDFGDEKDGGDDGYSVDDSGVATNDGIDPDFEVDKTIRLQ